MREVQIKIFVPDFVIRVCVKILLFYRRLRYGYPFRRIPLTQGQFAIVDDKDYETLAKYKWFAAKEGRSYYAHRKRKSTDVGFGRCNVAMHRQVLDMPAGKCIDHINHNGLDNRKANLLVVTMEQNMWNKRKNYNARYKGVSWLKRNSKWQVKIGYKNKRIFIGYFDDEESAARAYDAKAKELFGEYAALNFNEARDRG